MPHFLDIQDTHSLVFDILYHLKIMRILNNNVYNVPRKAYSAEFKVKNLESFEYNVPRKTNHLIKHSYLK